MAVTQASEAFAWGKTWPDQEGFRGYAAKRRVVPVVRRLLMDDITPVGLYRTLAAGRPGTFIMESAEIDGTWSRYSFIGVNSRATLTVTGDQATWRGDVPVGIPTEGNPIEVLRETLSALHTEEIEGLPPFTGGLVGALGWGIIRHWEPTLPANAPKDIDVPEMSLCLASDLAVVDHVDGSVWLIANAINFNNTADRVDRAYADAVARLDAMETALEQGLAQGFGGVPRAIDSDCAAQEPSFTTTREQYTEMIAGGKQAIVDGEVFQIVLSQRLDLASPGNPLDVYRVLRTINPSPYMYYFNLADANDQPFAVVGSSPETLVKVADRKVTTFPIAGSRPRGASVEEDELLAKEVREDPKEVSEHIMLVDLSRNDLLKVCKADSVEVVSMMAIKRFSHIMHMCSTVIGTMRDNVTALDVFTAAFPAGTLSGAPKTRAIALIDELEQRARGIYGGTAGYFSFSGNMDMAIAIRTAVIKDGVASVQAGGGIVADSQEETEYWETRNKAAAVVKAVTMANQLRINA